MGPVLQTGSLSQALQCACDAVLHMPLCLHRQSVAPFWYCLRRDCCLLQEFNIEKLQLLEAEKAKIRKDYERREGQIDVKKKM